MVIRVKGAKENNLKSVDVEFRQGLTVVTGVSGSGKTSLVFDTLYHEARRRFEEVFQFGSVGQQLTPALVDSITGLSPAVAVGQNLLNRNPNSTLATASGLHPFFRILYARFGLRKCPRCSEPITVLTEDEAVSEIYNLNRTQPVRIKIPLVEGLIGSHKSLLDLLVAEFGIASLYVDGTLYSEIKLDPKKKHTITLNIGELEQNVTRHQVRGFLRMAMALGSTQLIVEANGKSRTISTSSVCSKCGKWLTELQPKDFHNSMSTEASQVTWMGLSLNQLQQLDVEKAEDLFKRSELRLQAERLYIEITKRLAALLKVGLSYITLDRPSPTLSRGESQRVRLAVSLTSSLEDVLHVLDEPTIGQHPQDVSQLVPAFRELKGPVIYVEHDRVAAALADYAVDIGPGAGKMGGEIVFTGTPKDLWDADTVTGRYFSQREKIETFRHRGESSKFIEIIGASAHNLKNIDVRFPVGRLTTVTGVSGSGKSTLVEDVLVESLRRGEPEGCREIICDLKPVIVDQRPIGRNPRSTPATYTKISDLIRDYYAEKTGLSSSYFSFNRPEGACPTCKGMGAVEVKMRYLPSTWITCGDCDGRRYNDDILDSKINIGGEKLSIADFYDLSIAEAHRLLKKTRMEKGSRRKVLRLLKALEDIGLGYLPLGQPSPTLSGGEAQRVKLAKYLGGKSLEGRLIVLDEPSVGLHPKDINGFLLVLDNLLDRNATILIVEHNTDIIRTADWIIDLGPKAGPKGGEIIYMGPSDGIVSNPYSLTGQALRDEEYLVPEDIKRALKPTHEAIIVKGARVNNLKNIEVKFPKSKITVVTGVSGSGKSSLVTDTLEAEARRRYLETLSMYERQGTKEGPEAPVDKVTGLGVTLTITPDRKLYSRRNTVGAATQIEFHLAVLLSTLGTRICIECGGQMIRESVWICPMCGTKAAIAPSNRFDPNTYRAACPRCNGVGSLQKPNPGKLIIESEKPLCGGAMHSPGFFPKGYLCQPGNNGYDIVQAFAARHGFDPAKTRWVDVPENVRDMFYFGDSVPLDVTFQSRTGRVSTRKVIFPGFYGWVRDWDIGGTYTDNITCPACGGARLRPEYLAVKLHGYNIHELNSMPLSRLRETVDKISVSETHPAASNLQTVKRRLEFLNTVGLGYLHLGRVSASLSAGEAQRVKLAGLLGSELTNLTVLLDEPSRGLHPNEVNALFEALAMLRDEGNTVIIVEHDLELIEKADHIIDVGPGPGVMGGFVVAEGPPDQIKKSDSVTGKWLKGNLTLKKSQKRHPIEWMTIKNAHENNLKALTLEIPLGVLVGVCGVSGSGKSTLIVDTIGRILDPVKHTTSVAREPLEPGANDGIINKPKKTQIIDQTRKGISSPTKYLGLDNKLLKLFEETSEASALGLDARRLGKLCSVCRGSGFKRIDMGFLPDIYTECETCSGSGYSQETLDVKLRGYSFPEMNKLTMMQVYELFEDEEKIRGPLQAVMDVGLGYLVLHQPGHTLSGGEAQRLKIAAELSKKRSGNTLFILDEPTLGQHSEDVARLCDVLQRLVDEGNSVIVVEHNPMLLAQCDWLIELGPVGGEEGGYLIANCPPDELRETPTAPYIKSLMEASH